MQNNSEPKEGIFSDSPRIAGICLYCLCSVLTGFGSNYPGCNTPPPEIINILQTGSR